jgi:hypothetical protein
LPGCWRPGGPGIGSRQIRFWIDSAQGDLERLDAAFEQSSLGHFFGQQSNLCGTERLGQIIGRPALHRFDGGVNRSVSSDDHDLGPWAFGKQTRNEIQPILDAEPDIEEHQVKRLPRSLHQRLMYIAVRHDPMAVRFKKERELGSDVGLIIHDEDTQSISGRLGFRHTFLVRC